MHVSELWRYPVKSLKGERLNEVELTEEGLLGDRLVHVRSRSGRVITSRTKPRLLALQGTLGPDGQVLIDGRPWHAEESRAAVRTAAGQDAEPVAYDGLDRLTSELRLDKERARWWTIGQTLAWSTDTSRHPQRLEVVRRLLEYAE